MLPGPTIIISCPHCGQYAKKRTLISGNTFGSELWSNGKRIAPMLPEFPSLVLCKKCDKFYWVMDAKEVEKVNEFVLFEADDQPEIEKWKNVDYVEFPTFHEYYKALELGKDEKFIRISIWWSFNDYFRNDLENEITPDMQNLNNENLTRLLTLLNESDENDLLMKAEVLRNLGRFEESKLLLIKVKNPDLIEVKEKFLAEINNKNSRIFRLF
jgi:hypothetical protein